MRRSTAKTTRAIDRIFDLIDNGVEKRITSQETKALRGLAKKQAQKQEARRGRYANLLKLEGAGDQEMHPRVVKVSFDVTQEVAAALRALRNTGFYGNGVDCASVAEELLRRALRDPEVVAHWFLPGRLTPVRSRAELSKNRRPR
jgi:hypothetical protein